MRGARVNSLKDISVDGLRRSDTVTGRHFDNRADVKKSVCTSTGAIKIGAAKTNNLRNVNVDIPFGVLTVITGVAGSGRSSLVYGSLSSTSPSAAGGAGVVSIDQAAINGSRRSNPVTYTAMLEPIRKAFAKVHGVKPALFSANSEVGVRRATAPESSTPTWR